MEYEGLFDVSAELIAWNASELANNFLARWSDKTWMNTPGPFYCGNGDNCGTGPLCAPNNVHVDPEGFEIIFRQPVNRFELRQMLQAAWADPFHGYGRDGDTHWSLPAVRAWWREDRLRIEAVLVRERATQLALESAKDYAYLAGLDRWLDYLRHEAHPNLQTYAFFLEEGRAPDRGAALQTL